MSNWQQKLVNASVEVNRAIFEMNIPIGRKDRPWYKEKADKAYILTHIQEAICDLENAEKLIKTKVKYDDDE